MLFVGVLPAVFGSSLLVSNFPTAAGVLGISFLGIWWLLAVRRLVRLRQKPYGATAIGPLSPDEKLKARSKLIKAR